MEDKYVSVSQLTNYIKRKITIIAILTTILLGFVGALLCNFVAEKGVKNGYVMWPIRTAVSGKQMTPAGATEIMEIIGKEETISRVKAAIQKLS